MADLRSGLANNVIQYTNAEGVLITTTSSSTRRALEKQLDQAIDRQTTINSKVDDLNTKLFEYETEIVEVSTNNDIAGELGPLKFLSELTDVPMNKIINVLLLIIIFVFDPLAIALVIAANFAFDQLKKKYRENLYGEKFPIDKEQQRDLIVQMMKADEEDGLYDEALKEEKEVGLPKGYAREEIESDNLKMLEEKLKNTSKTNKYGPNGRKNLENQINDLKSKKLDGDDLTIKYN